MPNRCAKLIDLCLRLLDLDACVFTLNACSLSERLRTQILLRAGECIFTETTNLCVWSEESGSTGFFMHTCSTSCFARAFSKVARVHCVLRNNAEGLAIVLSRLSELCVERKGLTDPLSARLREKLFTWQRCRNNLPRRLQRGFILETD